MADRPILFSAPMVRAILREIEQPGTGKTQTRRLLKPQPSAECAGFRRVFTAPPYFEARDASDRPIYPFPKGKHCLSPYPTIHFAIGDRLYVREEWHTEPSLDHLKPSLLPENCAYFTPADAAWQLPTPPESGEAGRRRAGMHMPRWASRITLIVEDVRVERLQDISEADAIAEGCPGRLGPSSDFPDEWDPAPEEEYRDLWNSLHDKPGERWDDNPWIVAITFRPIVANIDQVPA